MQNPRSIYCEFCKSVGHDENNCHTYELMIERGANTYRIQLEEHRHEDNGQHDGWGGYQGRGRAGGASRGCGQIIFYDYDQLGHFARDCKNPTMTGK